MTDNDVNSFLTYLSEVKPFHTKLTDSSVLVQFSLDERLNVKVFDLLDSISVKLSSVWAQSWRQAVRGFPVYDARQSTAVWVFRISRSYTPAEIALLSDFRIYVDGVERASTEFSFTVDNVNLLVRVTLNDPVDDYRIVEADFDAEVDPDTGLIAFRRCSPIPSYSSWTVTYGQLNPGIDESNLVVTVNGAPVDPADYVATVNTSAKNVLLRFNTPISSDSAVLTNLGVGLTGGQVAAHHVPTTTTFRFYLPREDYSFIFTRNGIAATLPANHVFITPRLLEITFDEPISVSEILELVETTETNVLFTEKKNVFSFQADGTAAFREFNVPLTMFPRASRVSLKRRQVFTCKPIISAGETETDTFSVPFTNENYFSIAVNGVVQPFGSFILYPATENHAGRVRFSAPIPADSVVEFIVSYFQDLGNGRTFRLPFNLGFELYRNGTLETNYTALDQSTIMLQNPVLPTDEIEVRYYTIDRFEVKLNNEITQYKLFAYDSGTVKPVPDDKNTIIFATPVSGPNVFSPDPNRVIWARDVIRDPGIWINEGNNGVPLIGLGYDPETHGYDFTEWDAEFVNSTMLLELSSMTAVIGGKSVTQRFCKLTLANTPPIGTTISFVFHQGKPYLATVGARIRDGGFINVTQYVYGLGGYDMVGFDSDQLIVAPGSDGSSFMYEGPFDLEVFYDRTDTFTHPIERTQVGNPFLWGYDRAAFSDDVTEPFDYRLVSNAGRYWV